jgi:hypothetical protein
MLHRRLSLPPPRELPWPLKPLESAQTSLSYDEFGRMVMRIRHDVLKGLTPEMVARWFGNIGGDMDVDGKRLNRYLAWHPQDHIVWELAHPGPDGRASAGAKFHIVEAFGRNPDFYVDVIDCVTRLDATGFTAASYMLGQQVIAHDRNDGTNSQGCAKSSDPSHALSRSDGARVAQAQCGRGRIARAHCPAPPWRNFSVMAPRCRSRMR